MSISYKNAGWMSALFLFYAHGASATETDKWYRSPSFLGRGGAGLADPRDEDALFFNPANLYQQPAQGAPAASDPQKAGESEDGKAPEDGKAVAAPEGGQTSATVFRKGIILAPLLTMSDNLTKYTSAANNNTKLLETLRDNVGKPVHAGADNFTGALFGNFGLGLVTSMYVNFYVYRDPNNSGIEAVDLRANQNVGFTAGYGYSLIPGKLLVGVAGKYVKRTTTIANVSIANIDDIENFKISKYQNSGTGMGMDLGLIYKVGDPLDTRFGLHLADLGDTHFKPAKTDGVQVDDMKQTVGLGMTLVPKVPVGKTTMSLDLTDVLAREDTDRFKNFHAGIDYLLGDLVGFAVGINQGFTTWGTYLTTRFFRMDLGSFGEEVGEKVGERSSRRYYLRLMSSF